MFTYRRSVTVAGGVHIYCIQQVVYTYTVFSRWCTHTLYAAGGVHIHCIQHHSRHCQYCKVRKLEAIVSVITVLNVKHALQCHHFRDPQAVDLRCFKCSLLLVVYLTTMCKALVCYLVQT